MLSEHDVEYLLMRLAVKPDAATAHALRRVYLSGIPFGSAAREQGVPVHRMERLWRQAETLRAGFTVTELEAAMQGVAAGKANDLLAYQRRREVEATMASAQRSALKAAGLTDEQITTALVFNRSTNK